MATLACAAPLAASKARPIRAARGERIVTFGLQALTRDDTVPPPAPIMHKRPLCFQWLRGCIVNAGNGANKAGTRAESGAHATFWQRRRYLPVPPWLRG